MSEALALKLDIDAKGAKKTLGDLEKASAALNDELKETAVGSKEFKELKSALIGVESELKNVELGLESLDNEQVAGEIGGVTGALGDMTGAFVLLGGQSKTMEEMAANVQTVMGVTMGLKGSIEGLSSARKLWNHYIKSGSALQKGSVILTKAQGVATGITAGIFKIFGKTVKKTTFAFKSLKAAIIASGVGLAVIAVGELISFFMDWASSEEDLTETTDVFNAALEKQGKILEKLRDQSEDAASAVSKELKFRLKDIQIEIEQMKLKGASAGALHAKQMEYRAEEEKAIIKQIEINKKAHDIAKKGIQDKEETVGMYDELTMKGYELVKMTGQLMRIDPKLKDGLPVKELVTVPGSLIMEERFATEKVLVTKQEEKDAIVAIITERQKEIESYADKNEVLEVSLIMMQKENTLTDLKAKNQKKITKNTNTQTKAEKKATAAKTTSLKAEEDRLKGLSDAEAERLKQIEEANQNRIDAENQLLRMLEDLDEVFRKKQLTDEQREIEAVDNKYFEILNSTVLNEEEISRVKRMAEEERNEVQEKYAKLEIQRENAIKDAKLTMAQDSIGALMNLTTAFAKDNEKSQRRAFEINKKLQIAQALIGTYQGVQAIFTSAAMNPASVLFPAMPYIQAAIALASGLANVKNISKQQFSGGGIGGSAPGFSGGGGGGTSAPTLNPISNTNTLLGQDNKVYVTETDISTTQNKVKVIEDQATF
jgi:hypothetical protein